MPIKIGNNDIGDIYVGSNKIGEVYIGSNLVYTSGRAIKLSSGTSWNIKNLYPNIYNKLSANNFFVSTIDGTHSVYKSVNVAYEGDVKYISIWGQLIKSYNATSGVLTMYYQISGNTDVACPVTPVMVTDLNKISSIAKGSDNNYTATGISGWQNFNINNFFFRDMTGHYLFNGSRTYPGTWGGRSTIYWTKSYNTSNGKLYFYLTNTISEAMEAENGTYYQYGYGINTFYVSPKGVK